MTRAFTLGATAIFSMCALTSGMDAQTRAAATGPGADGRADLPARSEMAGAAGGLASGDRSSASSPTRAATSGRRARSRITEWDPQGKLVQSWDARGPDGNWSTIHGMFVDHNGFVWTNARESNLTVKFTRKGQVALVIGKFNETGGSNDTTLMGRPSEIWVDPADNEVFVADGYGNRRIIVFDGATGKYLRHWGAYGKRPEDPPARRGGAVAPRPAARRVRRAQRVRRGCSGAAGAARRWRRGRCAVAAAGRARSRSPAQPPQQFSVPHGITGSRDGLIYLADRANNRIQVFRQNGEFVAEKILRPRCGAQEQATWTPKRPCGNEAAFSVGFSHDVPQTYLYVADGGTHVITVLRRKDLEVVSEFGGPGVGSDSSAGRTTCRWIRPATSSSPKPRGRSCRIRYGKGQRGPGQGTACAAVSPGRRNACQAGYRSQEVTHERK